MFNALIRNNEQFDPNLHHITFFNIFFEEIEYISKGKSYLDYFVLFIQIYTQICWLQELYYLVFCS